MKAQAAEAEREVKEARRRRRESNAVSVPETRDHAASKKKRNMRVPGPDFKYLQNMGGDPQRTGTCTTCSKV